jgi:hypothetical protein
METGEGQARSERIWAWIYKQRILLWIVIFLVDLLILTLLISYLDHAATVSKGEPPPLTWYMLLGREALFAVALACILALLSETPIFANYLQNRFADLLLDSDNKLMDKFERSASVHLLEQLTRADFFRTLSYEAREAIEQSLLDSQLGESTPAELSNLLQGLVKTRRGIQVWRSDCRWVLRYEDLPSNPNAYRIHVDKHYTYHNCARDPVSFEQTFKTLCDRIRGVNDRDLCKTDILQVNGRDCLADHPQTVKDHEHRVLFFRRVPITIPVGGAGSGLSVRERAMTIYGHSVPYVSVNLHALYSFDISIQHPATVVPVLYVFGFDFQTGSPLVPPVISEPDLHQWSYKGWLLPSQGFLILFTRRADPSGSLPAAGQVLETLGK